MKTPETPKFTGYFNGTYFKDGVNGVPPELDKANEYFQELYGIPFTSAVQLSELPGPIGERWKKTLDHLNDTIQKSPQK